jgi:hypothetical protein
MNGGLGFGFGFPLGVGAGIGIGIASGRSSGRNQAYAEIEQQLRRILGRHVVSIQTQEGQPVSHEEFVQFVMSGENGD